jgi:adsorption protein B
VRRQAAAPRRPPFPRARRRAIPPDLLIALSALLAALAREGLLVCGLLILANGIDDLAMDAMYPAALLARRRLPPSRARLRFAILVPAWDEAAVIGPMLRRLLGTLDHPDFRVFVGVYPNDPATRAAVLAVEDPRVLLVTTDAGGPTTKAHCLNCLWRVARAGDGPGRFDAIVLHDAEDVLHPDELSVFEAALVDAAMVQIPVLPLVDRPEALVAGHYLDEFAQSHAKDMVVRSAFGAPLPSAGVGTALRLDAVERLEGPDHAPFDPASLTEDYEIGYRLAALGLASRMVRVRRRGTLVAVGEHFPDTLDAAVRQKSRWLTGIALAGWDRIGWRSGLIVGWLLFRDRKGIGTALLAIGGYAVLGLVLLHWLTSNLVQQDLGIAREPLLRADRHGFTIALLSLSTLLLVWRLILRAGFTWQAAGPIQAMLSIPRAPVGNLVNALAALRAMRRFEADLATGRAPAWEKTQHRFPEARHG